MGRCVDKDKDKDGAPAKPGRSDDIAAFVEAARKVPAPGQSGPRGRLIFALDATMSRQPTWDLGASACRRRCSRPRRGLAGSTCSLSISGA